MRCRGDDGHGCFIPHDDCHCVRAGHAGIEPGTICPHCSGELQLADHGQTLNCPGCGPIVSTHELRGGKYELLG